MLFLDASTLRHEASKYLYPFSAIGRRMGSTMERGSTAPVAAPGSNGVYRK